MKVRYMSLPIVALLVSLCGNLSGAPDNPRVLLGAWSGRATGPQGAPPTGDIILTIEKGAEGLAGKIVVKGTGGGEYSGAVSAIALEKGLFSATATFKLGEAPLEIRVSGPLKGKSIAGGFSAHSQGKKLGEGTFQVTKQSLPAKKK